jgi:mono/diheme cytochrome c family protein
MILRIVHRWLSWALVLAWCSATVVLSGCGTAEAPRFRLNMEGRERSEIPEEQQKALVNALTAMFGTPDEPYVFPETGLDVKKLQLAAGASMTTQTGERHGLYRQHCVHCHGVSGDGVGPTAAFLNPYPRDYRKGTYKFTSTGDGAKPTNADLKRTIINGIPGTAMPSFSLLPEDEVDALVEYVKYLSLRGETEELLFAMVVNEGIDLPLTRDVVVEGALQPVVDMWARADSSVVIPPERPAEAAIDTPEQLAASIEEGRKLFWNTKAQCVKCHGPTGLGDGEVVYDIWNKPKLEVHKNDPDKVAELFSLPLQPLQPRNLRTGVYRGGRRPMDIYRRIHSGIKGSEMPAAGATPQKPDGFKPHEIWQLVDYVRSLPYQSSSAAAEPQSAAHLTTN